MNFEKYLKSKAASSKSIKTRLSEIRMFWKWLEKENLEAEQVSYNDLLAYMKYTSRKGASQRTIQHYMCGIRHYYDHLISEEKIELNPTQSIEIKGVKRKTLYHILETHELLQLYNRYPNNTPKDKREKVMLGLLINQGITTAELGKLEVKDVNLREGTINIPGSRRSEYREMKLASHQVMDMHQYVNSLNLKSEKLFVAGRSNISRQMSWLMVKVRKMNPTVLHAKHIRASVITKWLKIYNLREVQHLAGHRFISSTESYQENDMEGLIEEINQYHPLG